ncbi:MAG TPA: ADP-ribosylglycohydrolase family protein [Clostridiales bacterium]|nr:ADP-ribosylglycohydrolase family protein [Clostridiales bacterium]
MTKYEKILGSLLGAAIGDTMGAATEMRTTKQIEEFFGGYVTEILTPPNDTFARGAEAGFVTDDFSLAYFTAQTICDNNGEINEKVAIQSLLLWAEHEEYFGKYVGPTTKAAIKRLLNETVEETYPFLKYDCAKATNGSAMKIGPVGLFRPGDIDRAIEDAVTICLPTHNNNLSISGACAVAAAVSKAMENNANVYDLVQAGLYGARKGFEIGGKKGIVLAGQSVERKINLAVEIALRSDSLKTAMTDIADLIGSGLMIHEAVPAAFGLLVAAKGNAMESICAGVNIGYDTDTTATIIGAMTGALQGVSAFSKEHLELINFKNNFDLEELACRIEELL